MQNLRVFRNTVVGNQSEGISIKLHGSLLSIRRKHSTFSLYKGHIYSFPSKEKKNFHD